MRKRFNSLIVHFRKLGFFQTIIYLQQRFFKGEGELIRIKIRGLRYPLCLRNKFYDTNIFYQIFIKEELNFNLQIKSGIIVDCGANIGLSTLYFKKKYPFCKIYSIEPEASNFKMLQLNIKHYQDIYAINAAVWHNVEELYIVDPGEGHASFITSKISANKKIIGTISTVTLADLIRNVGDFLDLLKIDIEGSELELFANSPNLWIDKVRCLAVEIHEGLRPGATSTINDVMKEFKKTCNGEYTVYTQLKSL